MAIKTKTVLVTAQNAGTINGKKTSTLAADIDKAISSLGVDPIAVSIAPAGSVLHDHVIVTVLHEGKEEKKDSKK